MHLTMADVALRWLLALALDGARYYLTAGAAFLVYWVWGRERFRAHRVLLRSPPSETMRHDLGWSSATVLVFSLVGAGVYVGGELGVLRHHDDLALLPGGLGWAITSVPVLLVLQDTYFYWTHRAMHHPRLYAHVHRVHHEARTPSPWTAYAFALPEALVHAAFVPLVWLVLPLHEISVFVFLLAMIARNVQGHLSIELNRPGFTRHPVWGLLTTTTHHCLHHEHAGFDFGLYFTFWDRVMGTEHPRYHAVFERAAGGGRDAHAASDLGSGARSERPLAA